MSLCPLCPLCPPPRVSHLRQSEVRLPESLSPQEEKVLANMRSQLAEGLHKEAAATFLAEREVHPDSPLCAG